MQRILPNICLIMNLAITEAMIKSMQLYFRERSFWLKSKVYNVQVMSDGLNMGISRSV